RPEDPRRVLPRPDDAQGAGAARREPAARSPHPPPAPRAAAQGRVVRVRRGLLLVALVAALGLGLVPAFGAGPSSTFKPPSGPGPKGGDQYNFVTADPGSGRVSVARVSPYPGAFNCSGAGGFAYLRLQPVVTRNVTSVVANVGSAAVDGYTWVSVLVRARARHWLGSPTLRGRRLGP